jgi:hypothetical protein
MGSPGHAMFLSIVVTGELLMKAAELIYGYSLPLKWPSMMVINGLLRLSGWCDFEIQKLHEGCTMMRRYYLSSIYRGPTEKPDYCCTRYCIANKVNAQNYKTKHANEDCSCKMVDFKDFNLRDAARWIRSGHTGVITG